MPSKKLVWQPQVLVLHEGPGDVILDASTQEALFRSALSVIRGRLRLGHWYDEEADPDFVIDAKRAISRKDGRLAFELLGDRKDAEYEGFELFPLLTSYLDNE